MAEILTVELQFGRYLAGRATDPITGNVRRLIWINFDPQTLFGPPSALVAGAFYDPSDLSSIFQDTAGTTPAIVNSPVARMNDKSGNGNHVIQATGANQPILRQSGNLFYLEFDGINDALDKLLGASIFQPWSRVGGYRQITWGANLYIVAGANDITGGLFQTGVSPNINLLDGVVGPGLTTLAVGVDGVVSEFHNGAASSITLNNGAPVVGDPGSSGFTNITIGGLTPPGTNNSNIRFYGMVLRVGAFTTNELTNLRQFMGQKTGAAV